MTNNHSTCDMLENRHKWKLVWQEPWQGLTADGNDIDCHIELRATIHDCINMHRRPVRMLDPSDKEILESFIAVNWAYVEVVDD